MLPHLLPIGYNFKHAAAGCAAATGRARAIYYQRHTSVRQCVNHVQCAAAHCQQSAAIYTSNSTPLRVRWRCPPIMIRDRLPFQTHSLSASSLQFYVTFDIAPVVSGGCRGLATRWSARITAPQPKTLPSRRCTWQSRVPWHTMWMRVSSASPVNYTSQSSPTAHALPAPR